MAATWCSSWPRSQCHGEYSRTFCGSSRDCDRRRPQREALNGEACNTTTGEVRRDDEKSVPRNAGSVQIPAFGGSKRVSRWTVLAARAEKAHSERSACKLSGEYRFNDEGTAVGATGAPFAGAYPLGLHEFAQPAQPVLKYNVTHRLAQQLHA